MESIIKRVFCAKLIRHHCKGPVCESLRQFHTLAQRGLCAKCVDVCGGDSGERRGLLDGKTVFTLDGHGLDEAITSNISLLSFPLLIFVHSHRTDLSQQSELQPFEVNIIKDNEFVVPFRPS